MKFLSEMMSKRKTAEAEDTPLDAPLDADGEGTADFPLPDFAAVAGNSLTPSAEDGAATSAEDAAEDNASDAAQGGRFGEDEDSYDWDISSLDLSDDQDDEDMSVSDEDAEEPAAEIDAVTEEEDMDQKIADDLAAAAAALQAATDEAKTETDTVETPDATEVEEDDRSGAAAALASFAAEMSETVSSDEGEEDEAVEAVSEADLEDVVEDDANLDGSDDMDDESALDAALSRLPGANAAPAAAGAGFVAQTVQQKMTAMRNEGGMPQPALRRDPAEARPAARVPTTPRPAVPDLDATASAGIAGESDDDMDGIAALSPLAALRAQREAALAVAEAQMPVEEAVEDTYAPEEEALEDFESAEAASEDELDAWAPEQPSPRPMRGMAGDPFAAPAPAAEDLAPAAEPTPAPAPEPVRPEIRSAAPQAREAEVDADLPEVAPTPRRAGRVKTRLLGFHKDEDSADPIAAAQQKVRDQGPTFPVGWIVVVKGPGRGSSFTLSAGASKIGRGEDQAVRLDFGDTSISRDNHAVIAYDDEQKQFFIGHGGKANLVRLNDMPVLSTEPLGDGDVIRIGETTLLFVALCNEGFSWTDGPFSESTHAAE